VVVVDSSSPLRTCAKNGKGPSDGGLWISRITMSIHVQISRRVLCVAKMSISRFASV